MQNIAVADHRTSYSLEDLESKRREHLVFWEFAKVVWKIVNGYGGLCIIENPESAESWNLSEMSSLPDFHDVVIDQCVTELRDPKSLKLYTKATRLMVGKVS